MTVVVNTSPLIALDRIGHLDVLPQLFGDVVRPQSVVNELQAGKHIHGGSYALFHAAGTADEHSRQGYGVAYDVQNRNLGL